MARNRTRRPSDGGRGCGTSAPRTPVDARLPGRADHGDSPIGPAGTVIRGHEFHYSSCDPAGEAVALSSRFGRSTDGFATPTLLATYLHHHAGGDPGLLAAFARACAGANYVPGRRDCEVHPMPEREADDIPTDDPRPAELQRAPSLVLVNTGPGKGKTSAAIGVVVRAVGARLDVAVVQFLKSGTWRTGEEKVCKQLGVDWWAMGEGFTWDSDDLTQDQAVAAGAWEHAKALIGNGTTSSSCSTRSRTRSTGDGSTWTTSSTPSQASGARQHRLHGTQRRRGVDRRRRHRLRGGGDQARLQGRHPRQEGHRLLTWSTPGRLTTWGVVKRPGVAGVRYGAGQVCNYRTC